MNPWHNTLRLNQPLRGVRLVKSPDGSERDADLEARLRARYEQGMRDGEKALREQLLQQRSDVLAMQQGVLQSLRQALPQVRQECEGTLIALALEVAQKLVAGLPIAPEMIEAAAREALAHVEDTHEVAVFLHKEDLELLQRINSPVLLTDLGGEKVSFQISPEVTRGGCLVRTRFGLLDARRETKLELLQKSLQT